MHSEAQITADRLWRRDRRVRGRGEGEERQRGERQRRVSPVRLRIA